MDRELDKERKKEIMLHVCRFVCIECGFVFIHLLIFFLDKSSFCVLGIAGWQLCWFATGWLSSSLCSQTGIYVTQKQRSTNK